MNLVRKSEQIISMFLQEGTDQIILDKIEF